MSVPRVGHFDEVGGGAAAGVEFLVAAVRRSPILARHGR